MSSTVARGSLKGEALNTLVIGMGSSVIVAHAEMGWPPPVVASRLVQLQFAPGAGSLMDMDWSPWWVAVPSFEARVVRLVRLYFGSGFLLVEGVFWAFVSCCLMLAVASLFWLCAGL